MAGLLFHPGKSVFLLVTILWLWHGGTGVLAQDAAINCSMLNWTQTETSITVDKNGSFDNATVVSTSGAVISTVDISGPSVIVINTLSPGCGYSITLKNGSSEVCNISRYTLPAAVSGLSVSVSTNSLNITWVSPNVSCAANYTYNVTVSGSGNVITSSGTANSSTATRLSPGQNYTVTVISLTPNSLRSREVSVTATTMPSPVISFNVTNRNETSLTVQWTVPSDTNQASYSYLVWVVTMGSNQTRSFTAKVPVGALQTEVISNLAPGVMYLLTVFSVTSNNVTSTGKTIPDATAMPSPVINFNVTNRNETSLTVQWTVPNDTNQASYSYLVWVVTMGSNKTRSFPAKVSGGALQTEVISNLAPGVMYLLTVFSVTSNNVTSTGKTIPDATTRPSPVSKLTVTERSETTLTLQWEISASDTNRGTYKYNVMVNSVLNATFNAAPENTIQTGQIKGLQPGVPYTLTVYSVTSDGIESSLTPAITIRATTNPSPVRSLALDTRTTASISITWLEPQNIYASNYSYRVQVKSENSSVISNATVKVTNYSVAGLQPGSLYNFMVQSLTDDVTSTVTNVQFYSDPNQPGNLSTSPYSDSVIVIDWTAPTDPNVRKYTYAVQLSSNDTLQANEPVNTTDTSLLIRDLLPGHLYVVTVTSRIETAISTAAQAYAQTKPQSVEKLNSILVTNTTASFSWDITVQPSSKLSGFQIRVVWPNGSSENVTVEQTSRSYTYKNLTPGENYTFEFRTFTASPIPPSPGVVRRRRQTTNPSFTTFSDPIVQYAQTVPGSISAVACKAVSGGHSLSVSWICPMGQFNKFDILVNNEPRESTTKCDAVTIEGLQPAYGYQVSVRTYSSALFTDSSIVSCQTDATGVIVGSIFGVLLFLVLAAVLAFLILKYRRNKGKSPAKLSLKRFPGLVAVEKFPEYFRQQHMDSDFGFADEYQLLAPIGTDQPQAAAQQPESRPKNRYTNVLPYDISRVKLRCLPGDPNSDYINANYMPGYNSNKEFIATQGPLPNTIGDFWRMVWEHRVGTMVMLTNCTEGGKLKCEHYWPLDYTPCTYDDITVTVTSETILPHWTTREFTLRHAKEPGIRYVSHFHYTVWPDHGVPDETGTVIQFRNLVRDHMDQRKNNGPSVVHCSAGVGRTGTLIALDFLMQQLENEKQVGVFNYVKKMRLNRPFMVQTESQYIFLNQCMLDVIQNPKAVEENIYENQISGDLIYENVSAVGNYGKSRGTSA